MHFKTALSKKYINIALSFQNCSLKNVFQKHMSNCPLKLAPSNDAFQNCYKLSIGNKNKNPVGLKILDMQIMNYSLLKKWYIEK